MGSGAHQGAHWGLHRTAQWLLSLVRGAFPAEEACCSPGIDGTRESVPSFVQGEPCLSDRSSAEERLTPGGLDVLADFVRCREAHLQGSLPCHNRCQGSSDQRVVFFRRLTRHFGRQDAAAYGITTTASRAWGYDGYGGLHNAPSPTS